MIPAGLYIHIPFCIRRCGYCAFATFASDDQAVWERYVSALEKEMAMWSGKIRARTVFFGGGTPSLLTQPLLKRVTDSIRTHFNPEAEAEWTIETHPTTVLENENKLAEIKALGFNRISFGIESFNEESLKKLDRRYTYQDIEKIMKIARREGISNINLDLILGWPWETFKDFERTLELAEGLDPEHLSLYPLSIEEGTPFQTQKVETDYDSQADQFLHAHEFLNQRGYEHYEVANYSKLDSTHSTSSGQASLTTSSLRAKHNLIYWHYEDYLALGLGAASKIQDRSFTKARALEPYCKALENGFEPPLSEEKRMDADEIRKLSLIMRLRLKEGVPEAEFQEVPREAVEKFQSLGYISRENGRAKLNPQGWLVSNQLFSSII